MPRIRTLKPEAFQHRKVGRLSHAAFRLWAGMICHADDYGRIVADPEWLRVIVFGYHPTVDVPPLLAELAASGLVRVYAVEGTPYADLPSWPDHQKVDHPRASCLPEYDPSLDASRMFENVREGPRVAPLSIKGGSDRTGPDRIGSEGSELTTLSGTNHRARRHDALEVLRFLNEKTGRSYRETTTNLKLIEARLSTGATVANCRGVIARKVRQWAADPKMARYLRPETLFNPTKFESYLGEKESANADDGNLPRV